MRHEARVTKEESRRDRERMTMTARQRESERKTCNTSNQGRVKGGRESDIGKEAAREREMQHEYPRKSEGERQSPSDNRRDATRETHTCSKSNQKRVRGGERE